MNISSFKPTSITKVKINNAHFTTPKISTVSKVPSNLETLSINMDIPEENNLSTTTNYNIGPTTEVITDENGVKIQEIISQDGIVKREIIYQNGIKYKINNYDEQGNLKSTHIYENTGQYAGQYIIEETLYNYDDAGILSSTAVKDVYNKMITKTEYENGELARISKYQYNNNGIETLINTIEVSEFDELIKKNGNITYEDIQNMTCFDYGNAKELSSTITSVLTTEQIEEINTKIQNAVEYAGKGTGAGVAAAAITLITELQNKGIYLPYYYGGGHGNISTGIDNIWGNTSSWTGISEKRNINSIDCSGFLMWAMQNGGVDISNNFTANSFLNLSNTSKISFNELTAGDVMADSGHVVLVLDTYQNANGETIAICAEATGTKKNNTTNGGVIITTFTESQSSSYSKIDMDNYYSSH